MTCVTRSTREGAMRKPQYTVTPKDVQAHAARPRHHAGEVYRGPAKSGTSHFHAYATAYVIRKGQRFTVALAYVRKGQPLRDVVRDLLRQAAKAGVRPRYLLLDRGFWGVGVL